jgi:hypothetical protein
MYKVLLKMLVEAKRINLTDDEYAQYNKYAGTRDRALESYNLLAKWLPLIEERNLTDNDHVCTHCGSINSYAERWTGHVIYDCKGSILDDEGMAFDVSFCTECDEQGLVMQVADIRSEMRTLMEIADSTKGQTPEMLQDIADIVKSSLGIIPTRLGDVKVTRRNIGKWPAAVARIICANLRHYGMHVTMRGRGPRKHLQGKPYAEKVDGEWRVYKYGSYGLQSDYPLRENPPLIALYVKELDVYKTDAKGNYVRDGQNRLIRWDAVRGKEIP